MWIQSYLLFMHALLETNFEVNFSSHTANINRIHRVALKLRDVLFVLECSNLSSS
jgi:hypothetical protein